MQGVTTPVYLVRHAKAGHRETWDGEDELRPLTEKGWRQARALVDLFADHPFTLLLSSPYVRCVQTLEPLAEARGLSVEPADGLAEGASTDATLSLVLGADTPMVLCTHGDIMQNVLDAMVERDVRLDSPLELGKGSTWIIDVADGAIAGARYIAPP